MAFGITDYIWSLEGLLIHRISYMIDGGYLIE